ncbi:hypothetical protein ACLB2K_069685 [Fragaria x ananassa]
MGTPGFVRWNIKEIFDRKDVQKMPTFLEDLIRECPWKDKTDDNEMEEEDCSSIKLAGRRTNDIDVKAADIHIEQLNYKENKEFRESLKEAKAKKTKKKNIMLKMQMVVATPKDQEEMERLEENVPNTVDAHSRAPQNSTPEDART